MKARAIIVFTLAILYCGNSYARDYTFSIVPQQSAAKIARLWGPLLKQISSDTGLSLKLTTAKDIPTFEKRLTQGKYDFAYMNPYHFTVFSKKPGYLALAHQKDKYIRGIVVVRKDSPLTNLAELDGSTLAFPSPAAFAASILTQAKLINDSINYTPRYVSSHDSVYLAVARGLVPAGGGVIRTFKNTDPALREQLKIFWTTPKYTPHAFAAHPAVPHADRLKLQAALSSLDTTEAGRALLSAINFKGIKPAESDSWNDVRELNLSVLSE
ncbi:phosphate ABC transporter substrate-binding protein [Chromatiales bacterium (ex Bugula neritina AB1)]|nr:phosphate ABC transporter substrate-binding protein [Chromatiales bacterium (ex Bugula neritina AB1)]